MVAIPEKNLARLLLAITMPRYALTTIIMMSNVLSATMKSSRKYIAVLNAAMGIVWIINHFVNFIEASLLTKPC